LCSTSISSGVLTSFSICWCIPASPEYEDLYARQLKKQHKLATLEAKKDEMERVARSKVGLWSEYGLAAVRDKFWYMVNEGTGFAKRSTWWDAFFLVLSGRGDEGIAGFLMRLLMNFVFNFTIGMFGAISISFLPMHSLPILFRLSSSCAPQFSMVPCRFHRCMSGRASLATEYD